MLQKYPPNSVYYHEKPADPLWIGRFQQFDQPPAKSLAMPGMMVLEKAETVMISTKM